MVHQRRAHTRQHQQPPRHHAHNAKEKERSPLVDDVHMHCEKPETTQARGAVLEFLQVPRNPGASGAMGTPDRGTCTRQAWKSSCDVGPLCAWGYWSDRKVQAGRSVIEGGAEVEALTANAGGAGGDAGNVFSSLEQDRGHCGVKAGSDQGCWGE